MVPGMVDAKAVLNIYCITNNFLLFVMACPNYVRISIKVIYEIAVIAKLSLIISSECIFNKYQELYGSHMIL